MTHYLYPKNLKAKANLWLWGMKDFFILCVLAVVSVILLVEFGWLVPAAVTLCFAFLTIRKEDMTVLDYIRYAVKYFLTDQQYYEWRQRFFLKRLTIFRYADIMITVR